MRNLNLFIIDAIAPFFVGYQKRVINWSKIPFSNLEAGNRLDLDKTRAIREAYGQFLIRIKEQGFNAISIDDVAHLVLFDFYPEDLRSKIRDYRAFFGQLFRMTADAGIKIYLNTDIMFFNEAIKKRFGTSVKKTTRMLHDALEQVFRDFPVDGIIFRIGECDGSDVVGDFNSRLTIKTPRSANRFIRELIPLFEDAGKLFIFRTWTVGSYRIGDLIWNEKTFKETFKDITSPNFIISMKYGDTDFFGALELNPLFYSLEHPTLLELQTRRERECFGVMPYYVGWDYEEYYRKLKAVNNLAGISVWCQTGGWSRNKELTFLENSSIWNELNTAASIRIFKDGWDADQVVSQYFPDDKNQAFLRKFHDLFFNILYPKGFSEKNLYFRRTRIPPLIWLSWDYITVNPLIKTLYRKFDPSGPEFVVEDNEVEQVREMGRELNIERIDFLCDTLRLFLHCTRAVFGDYPEKQLISETEQYREQHSDCNLKFRITPESGSHRWIERLLPVFVRNGPNYRLIDRIILNDSLSLIQLKLLLWFSRGNLPKYANKRAMNLDVLFK